MRLAAVEAMQWDGSDESALTILRWVNPKEGEGGYLASPRLTVYTIDGAMTASQGDYIVRSIRGVFYTCRLDIFEATHEPAGEDLLNV